MANMTRKELRKWATENKLLITEEEAASLNHFMGCRTLSDWERPVPLQPLSDALRKTLNRRILDVGLAYAKEDIRTNSNTIKGKIWEAISTALI